MEPHYKDSGIPWIGQIPEHWEVARIKDLFNLYAGATPKSDNPYFWDGNIVWVTPADYKSEDHYISQGRKNISIKGYESCATFIVPRNSIIFSKRAPIGAVAIASEPLCTNQGCISCVPLHNTFSNFYYYLFCVATEALEILGTGTTFMEISALNFSNFKVLLPPFAEQERIAAYLDGKCGEIDELIEVEQQMIADLEAYRQSVITEAVTHGLNPNVPTKPTDIRTLPFIPKHWATLKTLYVLNMPITDGPHETPEFYEEGIPFISAESVSTGKINFSAKRGFISEEYYNLCCKKYIPKRGDIFMVKSGATTGKTAIVETDIIFTIWSPLAVFRANETMVLPHYLLHLLRSNYYQSAVEDNWTMGTQQNIGMRVLEKIRIPLPPLEEQREIAEYLDGKCREIDELIRVKQQKIAALKQYRQSLIFEVVTGKVIPQ